VLASWKLRESSLSGLSDTTLIHIQDLPWIKCAWQLPVLWTKDIIDEALAEGASLAIKEHPESEQEIIQACLDAKHRTLNRQSGANKLARVLEGILVNDHAETSIQRASTLALAFVISRTCLHKSGKLAMLPVLDCANHASSPVAVFTDAPTGVSLTALEALTENQEVTISYSSMEGRGPATFFSSYGFIPDGDDEAIERALHLALLTGQKLSKAQVE
jgi:hypothetical protein